MAPGENPQMEPYFDDIGPYYDQAGASRGVGGAIQDDLMERQPSGALLAIQTEEDGAS
jgi:hypothetical protein